MNNFQHHTINRSARPASYFKKIVNEYFDEGGSNLKFNQVNDFVDEMIGFDNPSLCKHVLLVYEEIETARQIELRYLKDQLQRGQTCACLIHGEHIEVDENMLRTEMIDNGIDVDTLEKIHQLRIVPITESIIQSYNLKTAGEIVQAYSEILRKGKPPSAGFGIIASEQDLIKPERLALQLELEQIAEQMIEQSDATWICPYHVDDIFESLEKEWMQKLVLSHDAVIYVQRNSNGLAFKLV